MNKKKLLLAIELNRQHLEHAVRMKDNAAIDESWGKLIQLYVALADIEMEELLRFGAA